MNNLSHKINVLVIGDMMIDHYIYGNCNRISPEAPVQVVEVQKEEYTLGGAGNVLKNLIAFDCKVSVISITGTDEYGQMVLEQLSSCGVSTDGILQDSSRCTTVKSRVLASNHHLIRLDRENLSNITADLEKELLKFLQDEIDQFDIVLVSDYNKGLLTPAFLKEIFRICREKGIKTLVDPKGTDFSKYKGVNVIKPNKKEAALATGIAIKDRESLQEACAVLKELTGCDQVIITLSEEGIAYYTEKKLNLIPTKALGVIDVTGAGDTVLAALGVSLASNKSLQEACEFANHAAAIVVSKVGSAVASFEEIDQRFPKV
ncbi:D-glycero-beta-D-manno-heptose-7-phosphate kinase [Pedobacter sp. HMWF019]|uniref:D-glycero-beta-D-manno-heptose-7-phosphate kinase n=1 Tax=Pedobacter sp. HMWF019 TaxID=2056856 RepID=UPI000D371613|nr:D-glycero-beta-D-manno-heptose-7-phosphate kinase [Pedobacter sp. HMWF019]PTS95919.1 D-glycero-beta-D-manno-heptose-7-phosphate kinase [Pedobacter sp. HMWF019]